MYSVVEQTEGITIAVLVAAALREGGRYERLAANACSESDSWWLDVSVRADTKGERMERGGQTVPIRPAERLVVWYPMAGSRALSRAWCA